MQLQCGYLDLLLEKRTQCRRSVSESWLEREVSSLTPTRPNLKIQHQQNPRGNDLIPGWLVCTGVENEINLEENLGRDCSKKLGTQKATKVGHTALPPHLKTKLSFDQINDFGILQYNASYWNIVCIDTRISLIGLLNHFLASIWLKQKLGMHLPNVKAKNLPEENWTLCHKGVEAPEDWWYLKL